MKKFIPVLLFLVGYSCFAQIEFQKGYMITNGGDRTEIFIKNLGWKNNPVTFLYTLEANGPELEGTLSNTREFGIPGSFQYVRAEVPIDRSSDKVKFLTNHGRPLQEEKKVFLQTLIRGTASLYFFRDENREHFFYQTQDQPIEPLIFKRYIENGSTKIRRNNQFQQQLWNNLKCEDISREEILGLEYQRQDLTQFFRAFNNCQKEDFQDFEEKQSERDAFNLSLRPGVAHNSFEMNFYGALPHPMKFESKTTLRVGVEMEYILPFYRNKLSFAVEPTYQYFEGQVPFGEGTLSMTYQSLEIPLSVRHYFFLNERLKAFVNAGATIDVALEGSEMDFETNLNAYTDFAIETGVVNPVVGAGVNLNDRYSVEFRYSSNRTLTDQFTLWGSAYSSYSLIIGYNFL